jgi:hypothetical protein
MRTITLANESVLSLWQGIQELPAGRHSEFQHWVIRESGIGSDAASVEQRLSETAALLAAGRTQEAGDALALVHYCLNEALGKFSSRQLAFGCLVAEWRGKPWVDTSEEGLSRLRDELSAAGLTEAMVVEEVEAVKKELGRS